MMERRKLDRSHIKTQSFEITQPLKDRLSELAYKRNMTVSALIREILERYFEER